MTRNRFFFLVVFFLAPSFASADPILQSPAMQAHVAWQQRDQKEQTLKAIRFWEKAIAEDPAHLDLYTSLTRAYNRAYRQEKQRPLKKRLAEKARLFGEQALAKTPKDPATHAEYATALGQYAQANKGIGSLKLVRLAISELHNAVALDPNYSYAYMLLGQFYGKAPASPLSVGDKEKALEYIQKAVDLDPKSSINQLALAEIYLSKKMTNEARTALNACLAIEPTGDSAIETREDQKKARSLLASL